MRSPICAPRSDAIAKSDAEEREDVCRDMSPKDPQLWLNPLALAAHLGCSKEVMLACAPKDHPLSWRTITSGSVSVSGLQMLQMHMDQARLGHMHLVHDKYRTAFTVISSYDRWATFTWLAKWVRIVCLIADVQGSLTNFYTIINLSWRKQESK